MATESPPPTSPKSPTQQDLALPLSDPLPPSDDATDPNQIIQSLQNPIDSAPTPAAEAEEVEVEMEAEAEGEGSVSIDEEDELEFLNAIEADLYNLTIQQAEIEWSRERSGDVEIGESLDVNGNGDAGVDEEEGEDGKSGVSGSGKLIQGNSKRKVTYPMRPDAEDCAFYMKVGSCKFGPQCKFNHPPRRKTQGLKDRTNNRDDNSEKAGQIECKYYLSGGCKYGSNCKFAHGFDRSSTSRSPEVNFLGLPLRPGEKECPYYMKNGSCKYGSHCRFHHPEPTSVVGADSSGYDNGGTLSSQFASSPSASTWSPPGAFHKPPPFVPKPFTPAQEPPSLNPEWRGYQAPTRPPSSDKTLPVPPAFTMNNNLLMDIRFPQHQNGIVAADEYPERPGEPECSFFMKTGDCKFKFNCKFHHPKTRLPKPKLNPYSLNDKGLPLRPDQPVCTHYHRYGICKFGPACKYDHPSQFAILQTPFDQPRVT